MLAIHAPAPIASLEAAIDRMAGLERLNQADAKTVRRLDYETIHRRFEQGRLLDMALAFPNTYGRGLAEYIASMVGIDIQTLRDCHAVYRRAGDKPAWIRQWAEWEAADMRITWSMVRNWGRKGLPDDEDQAALQVEKELSLIEQAAVRLERRLKSLKENTDTYTPDQQSEALGVVQRVSEVISEVRSESVAILKPTRDTHPAYLDYIRSMPCLVCADEKTIAHHLDRGGMGTKGSDLTTIPLCTPCHTRLHDTAERSFWEEEHCNPYKHALNGLIAWMMLCK